MTVFLIGAVLLMVAALAFVLPPLLRKEPAAVEHIQRDQLNLAVLRDQLRELEADREAGVIEAAAYESARHELERRVAEEVQPAPTAVANGAYQRWPAVVVGLLVPILSISVYLTIGSPAGLNPMQQAAANEESHEITPEQIEGMVAALAQRLQNDPDNAEGWSMLARSYNAIGRFAQAGDAYARLIKLVPNDAGLLADYADTLAMAQNRSLQGEPEKLIERALVVDPKNIKALALSGSAAFERKDYAQAAARWEKILAVVPADSDIARSISGSIAEAKGMITEGTQPPVKQASLNGERVTGTVDIDPALRAQASDTDVVFIFARAAEGPRFPLAVLRKQVKDLPTEFVLDDSMSMTPEAKLSSVSKVIVGARISKNGSATPGPGDLEGLTEPVSPGATNLKIRINKRNG